MTLYSFDTKALVEDADFSDKKAEFPKKNTDKMMWFPQDLLLLETFSQTFLRKMCVLSYLF